METLIDSVSAWILTLPNAIHVATFIVAAGSLVSALSPTIRNSSKYRWIQTALDIISLNIAKAKDK